MGYEQTKCVLLGSLISPDLDHLLKDETSSDKARNLIFFSLLFNLSKQTSDVVKNYYYACHLIF